MIIIIYMYNKIATNCNKHDHYKCRRSETHNYITKYICLELWHLTSAISEISSCLRL